MVFTTSFLILEAVLGSSIVSSSSSLKIFKYCGEMKSKAHINLNHLEGGDPIKVETLLNNSLVKKSRM